MCGINEWHRETNKMSDSLFLKVSNELFEYKDVIQRVSVFLGGEPLLDKKLAEKISILKNGGIKNVFFTTNASLMFKDRALEILESGITQIDISLDSLKKEIYEKIRVGLKFDEVINNVLGLIELRNSGNFDTRIRIRITQMDCNANEIEDFRKFFKDNFKEGDSVYSKNLNTFFMEGELKDDVKQFTGFSKYKSDEFIYPKLPCYTLWNTMIILSDGRVGLCCVDMGRNVILGDLRKNTIKEVWQGESYKKIREIHLKDGRGAMKECTNCATWI